LTGKKDVISVRRKGPRWLQAIMLECGVEQRFPQQARFGTNAYPNSCASNQLEAEFDQENGGFDNIHQPATTGTQRVEAFGLKKGSIYPLAPTARLSLQFLQKNLTVDL
jgi:hypothetical protein